MFANDVAARILGFETTEELLARPPPELADHRDPRVAAEPPAQGAALDSRDRDGRPPPARRTVVHIYLEPTPGGAEGALASSGHPLPLLLRPDGSVETVGAPGTLLGLGPHPALEDRDLRLSQGDVLVLYTDGLTESRGESEPIDETRLVDLLAVSAGSDAEVIAGRLEHVALSRRPRDDLALLVLRVVG